MSQEEESQEKTSIKCVVVGDGAVGKTAMLMSFANNSFPEDYTPTVFDNYTSSIKYGDKMVSLALWDTAGQDDFERTRPLSYADTDVFIICYSIVDPNTFDNVSSKWHIELKTHCPNVPIIIVGTKKDLLNDETTIENLKKKNQAPITSEQGYKMRQQIGAYAFVECSAKTQTGLNEVFITAVEAVIDPRNRKSLLQKDYLKDKDKKCIVQ